MIEAPSAELSDLRARLVARYDVERVLGKGGMGTVYLARDLRLDRSVALKVLPAAVADDAVLRDRFLRETQLAASFSHPNIVPVHAIEEHDGLLAFAMGFVEGESVAERVARNGPMTVRETVRLLQDVGYALAYAHARGVVHRDIKPDNVMLERATGRALVMDFGIARRTTSAPAPADGLTRVGEVVGTPEYMSPEQATGDVVDGRSDLYSLGLVAWFALTGRTAMAGENTHQVLVRQLTEVLPPLASARGDLPPALASVVDRCVLKEPRARFADAAEMVDALERAQLSAPEIPLPVRMLANELGTIGIVVAFTTLIGWLLLTRALRSGMSDVDMMIPVVVLTTVVAARFGQVLGEAKRLARLGFDAAAVDAGLRSVVDEAEGVRSTARVDVQRIADRQKAVRVAWIMLAVGAASIAFAFTQRRPVAPGLWRTGPLGVGLLFNGLSCACVAFVLWLRSPMRMPVGEWAFRRFWLGLPGRWVLRWAMGQRGPAPSVVVARTPATAEHRRVASLEARVAALEQWRDQRVQNSTPPQPERAAPH